MRESIYPFHLHWRHRVFTDTHHRSTLEPHRFPVVWVQSTQRQADDSPVPGGGVDDCKTVSSLAIAVLPLLVICTHASILPHI
jgi:hypothetical protein